MSSKAHMFINYKSFSQASRICQFYRTPYVIVRFLLIRETKVSSILERETVEKTLQREHIHEFHLGSWIFYKTKQIFWWSHNQGILFFQLDVGSICYNHPPNLKTSRPFHYSLLTVIFHCTITYICILMDRNPSQIWAC